MSLLSRDRKPPRKPKKPHPNPEYVTHTQLETTLARAVDTQARINSTTDASVSGVSGRVAALELEVADLQSRVAVLESIIS